MFVVTVTFIVEDQHREAFMALMLENARLSLALEPGCHRFDVTQNPDRASEVFLYELYDDEAAFEAHKTFPHYLDFCRDADPLTLSKIVNEYTLVSPP
jgi:quinol monooxygenase YgiN